MQGTLRKYIIVCNLLLRSTQCCPFELLLPPESREHVFIVLEMVFSCMHSDTMHKAGLWDVRKQSEIVM